MSPLKIILIVLAVGVLLVAAAGVGGYLWFESNRERLRAQGEAAKAEAEAYAGGTDQAGCLAEAVRRFDECSGLMCEVKTKIFLENCARMARPTEGFCEGVPSGNEIMATVNWSLARCEALGKPGDQPCTRLVRGIQDVCHDE